MGQWENIAKVYLRFNHIRTRLFSFEALKTTRPVGENTLATQRAPNTLQKSDPEDSSKIIRNPFPAFKMAEAAALNSLGVQVESIWGNDIETIVFAQAYGHEKTLIFRFTLDVTQPPQSLTTRIVNCFHDLEVEDSSTTFPGRASMRKALWSAVAAVWIECCDKTEAADPVSLTISSLVLVRSGVTDTSTFYTIVPGAYI